MKRDVKLIRSFERYLRSTGVPRSLAVQFTGLVPDHVVRNLLPLRVRVWLALSQWASRISLSVGLLSHDATTLKSMPARGCAVTDEASSGVSPAGRESKQQRKSHAPSVDKARPPFRNKGHHHD
ncbi:hypothetical protein D3C76_886100 [compost metagenome]